MPPPTSSLWSKSSSNDYQVSSGKPHYITVYISRIIHSVSGNPRNSVPPDGHYQAENKVYLKMMGKLGRNEDINQIAKFII